MSIFSNISNKLFPARITQPNRLDEYILRMLGNQAIYPETNAATYLKNYTGNTDVFTIINKITEPASTVPVFQVDQNGDDVPKGKMLSVFNNPNPYMSRSELIEAMLSFYLIFGNAYMTYQSVKNGLNAGIPLRLDVLPPQWMEMKIGTYLEPIAGWRFILSSNIIDFLPGEILHWKEFNPDYDQNGTGHLYGMSRMKPILKTVIGSGSAYDSVVQTFQHQGAFGILTILGEDGKTIEGMGKTRLRAIQREYHEKYTGSKNAGKIVVTKWDHKWTNFGMTMVEMKVLEALSTFRGAIADAYNVPSQLLSGSKDRTYNNYKEAETALWSNAVKPSIDALLGKVSNWLAPPCREEGHALVADYSEIEALQKNKAEMVTWMVMGRVFTGNEIREACGYERIERPDMDEPLSSLLSGMTIPPEEETNEVMKLLRIPDYQTKN